MDKQHNFFAVVTALLLILFIGRTQGALSYTADSTYYMGVIAGQIKSTNVTNNYTTSYGTNAHFTIPPAKMAYCSHPALQFAMWADPSANVIRTVDHSSKVSTWLGVVGQESTQSSPVSVDQNGNVLLYNPTDVSDCFFSTQTNTWYVIVMASQHFNLLSLGDIGNVTLKISTPLDGYWFSQFSFYYTDQTGTINYGCLYKQLSSDSPYQVSIYTTTLSALFESSIAQVTPSYTPVCVQILSGSALFVASSTGLYYYTFIPLTITEVRTISTSFSNIVNLHASSGTLFIVEPTGVFSLSNATLATTSSKYSLIAGKATTYSTSSDLLVASQATTVSVDRIVSLCIVNYTNNEYLVAAQSSIRHLYKKTSTLPNLSVQVLETAPLVIRLVKDYISFGGFLYSATLASSHGTYSLDVTTEIQTLPFNATSDFSVYQLTTNYGMGGNLRSYPFMLSARQYALAGNANSLVSNGPSVDGTGSNAFIHFNTQARIAVDMTQNNIYFSSPSEHIIRMCNVNGTVTTVAGIPNVSGSRDTSGNTPALLNTPTFLAFPFESSYLYFMQGFGDVTIRSLSLSEPLVVSTIFTNSSLSDGSKITGFAVGLIDTDMWFAYQTSSTQTCIFTVSYGTNVQLQLNPYCSSTMFYNLEFSSITYFLYAVDTTNQIWSMVSNSLTIESKTTVYKHSNTVKWFTVGYTEENLELYIFDGVINYYNPLISSTTAYPMVPSPFLAEADCIPLNFNSTTNSLYYPFCRANALAAGTVTAGRNLVTLGEALVEYYHFEDILFEPQLNGYVYRYGEYGFSLTLLSWMPIDTNPDNDFVNYICAVWDYNDYINFGTYELPPLTTSLIPIYDWNVVVDDLSEVYLNYVVAYGLSAINDYGLGSYSVGFIWNNEIFVDQLPVNGSYLQNQVLNLTFSTVIKNIPTGIQTVALFWYSNTLKEIETFSPGLPSVNYSLPLTTLTAGKQYQLYLLTSTLPGQFEGVKSLFLDFYLLPNFELNTLLYTMNFNLDIPNSIWIPWNSFLVYPFSGLNYTVISNPENGVVFYNSTGVLYTASNHPNSESDVFVIQATGSSITKTSLVNITIIRPPPIFQPIYFGDVTLSPPPNSLGYYDDSQIGQIFVNVNLTVQNYTTLTFTNLVDINIPIFDFEVNNTDGTPVFASFNLGNFLFNLTSTIHSLPMFRWCLTSTFDLLPISSLGSCSSAYAFNHLPVVTGPLIMFDYVQTLVSFTNTSDFSLSFSDPDGDSISFVNITATHGHVSFSDLNVTYTAPSYFNSEDTLQYYLTDIYGGVITGEITVGVSNPPPSCEGVNSYRVLKNKTGINYDMQDLGCLSSSTDSFHNITSIDYVSSDKANVTIGYSAGRLLLVEIKFEPNRSGPFSFGYIVSTPLGENYNSSSSITIVNALPVVVAQTVTWPITQPLPTINVLKGAYDPDGDLVSVTEILCGKGSTPTTCSSLSSLQLYYPQVKVIIQADPSGLLSFFQPVVSGNTASVGSPVPCTYRGSTNFQYAAWDNDQDTTTKVFSTVSITATGTSNVVCSLTTTTSTTTTTTSTSTTTTSTSTITSTTNENDTSNSTTTNDDSTTSNQSGSTITTGTANNANPNSGSTGSSSSTAQSGSNTNSNSGASTSGSSSTTGGSNTNSGASTSISSSNTAQSSGSNTNSGSTATSGSNSNSGSTTSSGSNTNSGASPSSSSSTAQSGSTTNSGSITSGSTTGSSTTQSSGSNSITSGSTTGSSTTQSSGSNSNSNTNSGSTNSISNTNTGSTSGLTTTSGSNSNSGASTSTSSSNTAQSSGSNTNSNSGSTATSGSNSNSGISTSTSGSHTAHSSGSNTNSNSGSTATSGSNSNSFSTTSTSTTTMTQSGSTTNGESATTSGTTSSTSTTSSSGGDNSNLWTPPALTTVTTTSPAHQGAGTCKLTYNGYTFDYSAIPLVSTASGDANPASARFCGSGSVSYCGSGTNLACITSSGTNVQFTSFNAGYPRTSTAADSTQDTNQGLYFEYTVKVGSTNYYLKIVVYCDYTASTPANLFYTGGPATQPSYSTTSQWACPIAGSTIYFSNDGYTYDFYAVNSMTATSGVADPNYPNYLISTNGVTYSSGCSNANDAGCLAQSTGSSLGKLNTLSMKAQLGGMGLMANYTNGATCVGTTKRSMQIYMTCSANTTIGVTLVQNSSCNIAFEITHISACPVFMGNTTYNGKSYSVLAASSFSYALGGTTYTQYLNYFGSVATSIGGEGTSSLQVAGSNKVSFGNAPLTYFVQTAGKLSIWTITAFACSENSLTVRSTQANLSCGAGSNGVIFTSGDDCTLILQQRSTISQCP